MTSVVFSPCSLVSTPWQARAWGDWDATHSDDQVSQTNKSNNQQPAQLFVSPPTN